MNVLKLIGLLLIASALVVFGAQNTQSVSFHFLAWDTPSVPVVLALAIAVLVGVLLGWAVSAIGRLGGRRRVRDAQRETDARERVAERLGPADAPPAVEDEQAP